jgi:hypothetical protein
MTNEKTDCQGRNPHKVNPNEEAVKELAEKIKPLIEQDVERLDCQDDCPDEVAIYEKEHDGETIRDDNYCNKCFSDKIAKHLISSGYINKKDIKLTERKTTLDGQELLLYRLTRKEVLSIPLLTRQKIVERQVNDYFENLSDDEKLEELKRYCD